MLDIKYVRNNMDKVIKGLETRGGDFEYLRELISLDDKRKELILFVEEKKAFRNSKSKEIGKVKASGGDVSSILSEVSEIGEEISNIDKSLSLIKQKIGNILLKTPNVPRETLPVGTDESFNKEVLKWGTPKSFAFEPKGHWDLATSLKMIDFERAAKVTGSRFALYIGLGARLERAVAAFMLDAHTQENDYVEIIPPYIVNSAALMGTGQLPKFEDDLFKLVGTDYYLIPTAEVPVTNMYSNEVIDVTRPLKYAAFTPCFRSEAGSAGRDTKGIIRQHQFHKVELVKFVDPINSYDELEKLTNDAENILKRLELPYRKINLCTGDIGFSSKQTYDLEVWLPSYGEYKEISSCSNFEDFQARRANIKYRDADGKLQFVHTVNGSALAVGRCVAAIIENYQNVDGTITVPKELVKYMRVEQIK